MANFKRNTEKQCNMIKDVDILDDPFIISLVTSYDTRGTAAT